MNKVIIYTALGFSGFVAVYLVMAFIKLEISILNFSTEDRGVIVWAGFWISLMLCISYNIDQKRR